MRGLDLSQEAECWMSLCSQSCAEEDPQPCSQQDSLVDGKHVWTHPLCFCGHADPVIFVTSFLSDTTLCLSFRFFSAVPASSNLLILPELAVENPQLPVKHHFSPPTHTNCAVLCVQCHSPGSLLAPLCCANEFIC